MLTCGHVQCISPSGDTGVGKTTAITEMLDKLEGRGTFDIKFGSILGKVLLHNEIKRTRYIYTSNFKFDLSGKNVSLMNVEFVLTKQLLYNDENYSNEAVRKIIFPVSPNIYIHIHTYMLTVPSIPM